MLPMGRQEVSVDRRLVMSSPVENNAGKQIMHAVPWVSDTRSQDEKRCLQEAVIEARQRLEGELSDELPKSDRIEDRRGGLSGIPGGRGGLGIGTIVVLGLIGWAL